MSVEQVIGSVANGVNAALNAEPKSVPSTSSRAGRQELNGHTCGLVPGKSLLIKFNRRKNR